jgi:hypothetical protein
LSITSSHHPSPLCREQDITDYRNIITNQTARGTYLFEKNICFYLLFTFTEQSRLMRH